MSDIERVTVTLTGTMAGNIRSAIASGEYASTSEVMRDALRLWGTRREMRARDLETMQQRWDAAKASGKTRKFDAGKILGDAQSRLNESSDT